MTVYQCWVFQSGIEVGKLGKLGNGGEGVEGVELLRRRVDALTPNRQPARPEGTRYPARRAACRRGGRQPSNDPHPSATQGVPGPVRRERGTAVIGRNSGKRKALPPSGPGSARWRPGWALCGGRLPRGPGG